MLGISVWSAIRHAIASITDYQYAPSLNTPATAECILNAVQVAPDNGNRKQHQKNQG